MAAFWVSRFAQMLLTTIAVSVAVFFVMRVLPGDVAFQILSSGSDRAVDPEALSKLRHQLGLNESLPAQYMDWLKGVVTLDPGVSLFTGRPIAPDVARRLATSYELAVLVMVFSLVAALPMGVFSAIRRGSWLDQLLRAVAAIGLSVPTFWIGVLLLIFFVRVFGWLPPLRYRSPFEDLGSNLSQLIWPALVISLHISAILSRMVRSAMLEVLGEDYIRTARAKGLLNRDILVGHALKNAALPILSLSGVIFAHLLGSLVVLETIFAVPGLGSGLIQAITQRDYPTVQTILMLFTLNVVVVNAGLDAFYGILNPRVRIRG